MPVSGLYFLPPHPSSTSTSANTSSSQQPPSLFTLTLDTLTKKLNPSPLPRWALTHHLYRSTPQTPASSSATPSASQSSTSSQPDATTRYLHVVTLSPIPPFSASQTVHSTAAEPKTHALITPVGPGAGTLLTISTPQAEDFTHLLTSKFGPLWTHRQTLTVTNGAAFELGESGVVVRVGEVRSVTWGGGGQVRGVAVEVTLRDAKEDLEKGEESAEGREQRWKAGEDIVRGVWETLGLQGGKEYLRVGGVPEESRKDGEVVGARQWCEGLRLRV